MLKIQFFEKIYFFHQKWFFSNGEGNFDNGSKLISLRIHRFSAQIPKTTKKKFQLVERKIPFLKMFLCTRIMQLWQPCRNFLVKTLKTFCCNSRNYENLTSSPKNLLVKMFVWTCIRKLRSLDKPAVTMPPKLRKIFFSQSPKRIAMQFFSKKVILLSVLPSKKNFHPDTQNPVATTLSRNFSSKLWKPFARIPEMMKKLCAFQKKISPQNVRLTCTMKFWQARRNFVPKNTKKFPELQKCWSYNFFNKFFFRQKWFFSNVEWNFDKASKIFSLKIPRFIAQIPKATKKSGIFWNDKKIPQNVPMYM